MLKTLLKLVFSVSLCLVLAEIAVRWTFPLPEVEGFRRVNYARDAAIGQRDLPALGHRSLWWWSEPDNASFQRSTNLYGFTDDEWEVESGMPRIGIFGDSFVEGLGAPEGSSIADVVEKRLADTGARHDVLNLGAGGFGLRNYGPLVRDATIHFKLDHVILILYMNDFYDIPDGSVYSTGPHRDQEVGPSRLLDVLRDRFSKTPRNRHPPRWRQRRTDKPQPIHVAKRFKADPKLLERIEKYVSPEIAESMKAGRLNPAMTGLLVRSERELVKESSLRPWLTALTAFVESHERSLWVAYIPSLNQVTDHYLPAQQRMSPPIKAKSLTGPKYQAQSRRLLKDCNDLGIQFLDLTPRLVKEEKAGTRLYWDYDGHMRAEGYRIVAEELVAWLRKAGAIDN